jgi:hypothetical protein
METGKNKSDKFIFTVAFSLNSGKLWSLEESRDCITITVYLGQAGGRTIQVCSIPFEDESFQFKSHRILS